MGQEKFGRLDPCNVVVREWTGAPGDDCECRSRVVVRPESARDESVARLQLVRPVASKMNALDEGLARFFAGVSASCTAQIVKYSEHTFARSSWERNTQATELNLKFLSRAAPRMLVRNKHGFPACPAGNVHSRSHTPFRASVFPSNPVQSHMPPRQAPQ